MSKNNKTPKHTPGPWDCRDGGVIVGGPFKEWARGSAQSQVALVTLYDVYSDERDANARLIAAAPEMLEALKRVVAVADRRTVEFDAARSAIAKAEGDL